MSEKLSVYIVDNNSEFSNRIKDGFKNWSLKAISQISFMRLASQHILRDICICGQLFLKHILTWTF